MCLKKRKKVICIDAVLSSLITAQNKSYIAVRDKIKCVPLSSFEEASVPLETSSEISHMFVPIQKCSFVNLTFATAQQV